MIDDPPGGDIACAFRGCDFLRCRSIARQLHLQSTDIQHIIVVNIAPPIGRCGFHTPTRGGRVDSISEPSRGRPRGTIHQFAGARKTRHVGGLRSLHAFRFRSYVSSTKEGQGETSIAQCAGSQGCHSRFREFVCTLRDETRSNKFKEYERLNQRINTDIRGCVGDMCPAARK